jgi:hypothetical protein
MGAAGRKAEAARGKAEAAEISRPALRLEAHINSRRPQNPSKQNIFYAAAIAVARSLEASPRRRLRNAGCGCACPRARARQACQMP